MTKKRLLKDIPGFLPEKEDTYGGTFSDVQQRIGKNIMLEFIGNLELSEPEIDKSKLAEILDKINEEFLYNKMHLKIISKREQCFYKVTQLTDRSNEWLKGM